MCESEIRVVQDLAGEKHCGMFALKMKKKKKQVKRKKQRKVEKEPGELQGEEENEGVERGTGRE